MKKIIIFTCFITTFLAQAGISDEVCVIIRNSEKKCFDVKLSGLEVYGEKGWRKATDDEILKEAVDAAEKAVRNMHRWAGF